MIIYKIINTNNLKVYIGQTSRSLETRWAEHLSSASRGGQNILYKAMRKYGRESFQIELIEETDSPNEREQFWIAFYDSMIPNGYNMTPGGEGVPKKLPQNFDDIVFDIGESKLSFAKIAEKYRIAPATVSDINLGRYYYSSELLYPLRQSRKEKEVIKQIKYALKYELDKTQREISEIYNCSLSVVNEINRGKLHYLEGENYPLRRGRAKDLSQEDILKIIELLKGELSQKEIARLMEVGVNTVSAINNGKSYRQEAMTYPIRENYSAPRKKGRFLEIQEVEDIENLLSNSTKSLKEIAALYEVSDTTIANINRGAIIKYRREGKAYPLRPLKNRTKKS